MKINRLVEIIIILLNRKTITSKELSQRFNVSQRTIYRDIEDLSSAGIPVYMVKGKGGGISLLENYILDKTILSNEEKENIIFALKTLGATEQLNTNNTLEKVTSLFGNISSQHWLQVDFNEWGNNKRTDKRFEKIRLATIKQRILEFKYVNSKNIRSNRMIEPYKIIFKGQSWYLLGFCCKKNDFRMFKITRMKEVNDININFQPRDISDFFKRYQDNNYYSTITLKLKFNKNMLYRIVDYYNEEEILEQTDGSYLVTVEFPYNEWIYSYILSYGNNVEVIEPTFVREEVRKRIKGMLNIY
ncbi:YafY family protein [Clostridium sp. Marseille-Q2269]|uniref:helix-turn-helix transcriptional regulator n=1 Tax=Clostridium sp. Marseille-Q2269 TaxID=2942205 RepID=UPI002072F45B|nr:YafY family protein [Clostridium sp. Marseille-Q2269]